MVRGPKVRGLIGQGLFSLFYIVFSSFLVASRQVPPGQLSPRTTPRPLGTCPFWNLYRGKLSFVEFVHLGTCPPGNMSTQELAQGEFPNPALKGRTETLQMTNIPQMLAVYIQYKSTYIKMYIPKGAQKLFN